MFETLEWGTYIFFAGFLFVGIFWVWFYLPETKNATLEDMDRVFKSKAGGRDAVLMEEAQREVGLIAFLERNTGHKGEDDEARESISNKGMTKEDHVEKL